MFQDASKIPANITLSPIAEPFVVEYLHETYSQEEAFQLFVQEAHRQGHGHYSDDQFKAAFTHAWYEGQEKDPDILALSDIADPFARDFMVEGRYKQQEAFQLFVQEARQQGYGQCTQTQFTLAFQRTYLAYR
jgi:hypothetical protein